jgi:BirA family transcriptional regulator, biotin operon repressor / biotin---[acetyl-CoA-carboxylase] ligase
VPDPTKTMPAFSVHRLQDLLRTSWLGRTIMYEPVVGSTMDIARALDGRPGAHGTVVVADRQTAGVGRFGRRWLTPPGGNIACSIFLVPDLPQLKALPIVTAVALVDVMSRGCDLECQIKWPNDVQAGGKKLAGILIESALAGEQPRFAISGFGINVNYDTRAEPEIATTATSLMAGTGREHEREWVLAACLNAFEALYEAPPGDVLERWRAYLNTLGRRIRVAIGDITEEGRAEDVEDDGSLILRRDDGRRVILAAGEVTLQH